MIQITQETNHPIILVIEVDHQNKETNEISHKIDIVDQIVKIISIEITIHDQIQTEQNSIDTIQTINHEIHHTIETETIQTIGIKFIQTIKINVNKTIEQETIHTTDPIINERITITTIIDHEIIHKIGI